MQFCKTILKVKKSTPHCMIYGELGRIPLNILIKARMVGFWQRIMCGKREKKSYTMYSILYQLRERPFNLKGGGGGGYGFFLKKYSDSQCC